MREFLLTDEAILHEIGRRLARRRVDMGLTQAKLARQAGVGRSTVERMEAGHSTQISSFIRVLRVLNLLQLFYDLFPKPGLHPMDLVKLQQKVPKRASSKRKTAKKPAGDWAWDDDS